ERLFTVLGRHRWMLSASLTTGQTASTGSPFTADPSNTSPVAVQVVDEQGELVGGFKLDPGESVDANVGDAPDGSVLLETTVIRGNVDVTVYGRTETLTPGETRTFVRDVTPPITSPDARTGGA